MQLLWTLGNCAASCDKAHLALYPSTHTSQPQQRPNCLRTRVRAEGLGKRSQATTPHSLCRSGGRASVMVFNFCISLQSLHINHMQMSIVEVFICRRLHMNTSMILICIWLVCRLCTTLHTKCCGAVGCALIRHHRWQYKGPAHHHLTLMS